VAYEYRTARRFKNPPPLFRWADSRGYFSHPGKALVFGAGLLVEANGLIDRRWSVDALETADTINRRQNIYDEFGHRRGCRVIATLDSATSGYDIITVTHVLEFIEEPQLRDSVLRSLADLLATTGSLLLSLRGWSDVRAARHVEWRGDGMVTGLRTWTRGYSVDEASELVERAGLRVVASPQGQRARRPEQVRFICQRP
jgi:hypothetical protein